MSEPMLIFLILRKNYILQPFFSEQIWVNSTLGTIDGFFAGAGAEIIVLFWAPASKDTSQFIKDILLFC